MKPKKEDRKKFDIDLKYGTIREEKIAEMLTNKKIEVKSERDMWMKTGNIAIEYESFENNFCKFTKYILLALLSPPATVLK